MLSAALYAGSVTVVMKLLSCENT